MVPSVDYKEPKAEVKFDFVDLEMIHLPLALIHFLLAGWAGWFLWTPPGGGSGIIPGSLLRNDS